MKKKDCFNQALGVLYLSCVYELNVSASVAAAATDRVGKWAKAQKLSSCCFENSTCLCHLTPYLCILTPPCSVPQSKTLCSWTHNIQKSLGISHPPLGLCRNAWRGSGADWEQQNAKSTHVCNGYTEATVQRDLPPHRSHCRCPLRPIIISINIMAEDRRTDDP